MFIGRITFCLFAMQKYINLMAFNMSKITDKLFRYKIQLKSIYNFECSFFLKFLTS